MISSNIMLTAFFESNKIFQIICLFIPLSRQNHNVHKNQHIQRNKNFENKWSIFGLAFMSFGKLFTTLVHMSFCFVYIRYNAVDHEFMHSHNIKCFLVHFRNFTE